MPTPTMAGWQASPRFPDSISVSTKKRLMPGTPSPGKSMRQSVPKSPPLWTVVSVDPVAAGLDRIGHLGGVVADVVVLVFARQRVHAVRAERDRGRGVGRRAPERPLERDEPAFDRRLVAELDVVARQPRVRAHGAALGRGDVPVRRASRRGRSGRAGSSRGRAPGGRRRGSRAGCRSPRAPSARARCLRSAWRGW